MAKPKKYATPEVENLDRPSSEDDAQPAGASNVSGVEEYETAEKARIARSKASISRSKAQTSSAKAQRSRARSSRVRSAKTTAKSLIPASISRAPRRVLIAELLAAVSLLTIEKVTKGEAPKIDDYMAAFVVFLILGFAAEVSDDAAHVAAGLGGLIVLAIGFRASPGLAKGAAVLGATQAPPKAVPAGGGARRPSQQPRRAGSPMLTQHPKQSTVRR